MVKIDDIRRFVLEKYLLPLAEKGGGELELKAGDIHREMNLHSRVPAVVSALGNRKSLEYYNSMLSKKGYGLRLLKREGPEQSPTTTFTYLVFPLDKEAESSGMPCLNENEQSSSSSTELDEDAVRIMFSVYLGIPLFKKRLDIYGKHKEFDLVNEEHRIVGDIKRFTYEGANPAAEFSNLFEYACLTEKLERYTGVHWRKIIVGYGRLETFKKFAEKIR